MACFLGCLWQGFEAMQSWRIFPMVMLVLMLGCASDEGFLELFDEASQMDRNKAAVEKLQGKQDTVAVFARGLC